MSPSLKSNDLEHGCETYSKPVGKLLHGELASCVKLSRSTDLLISQLVGSNLFAVKLPSFLNLVLHVGCSCSKEKMLGINTRRVVSSGAIMKHTKTIWNRANVQNPRSPRRYCHTSKPGVNATVSFVRASRPNPTRIGFIDFRPKPARECFGKTLRSQILRSNLSSHSLVCADRVTGPSALFNCLATLKG